MITFGWVRLELLGHRILHGFLYPAEVAPGVWMLALQVPAPPPEGGPTTEEYYGFAAVYGIHPTTEEEVIKALTPWQPPAVCGATFRGPVLGPDEDDTCERPPGHDGDHEGLPF